ncbi:hypothetical protein I6N95_08505 [Vagococcus sp. BWB3-3]|uniref:Lipoprotein n=1 Tax=Vagococcus allomyrinae TaxID=2794353 RepID=A0A940PAM5_9ENTE|nr:hypothetical protein [Vagococcus allomyrinae]MBP1041042.1 hypothetical protein [Vagococcus allomyrinae]
MRKVINVLTIIWMSGCFLAAIVPDPYAFPLAIGCVPLLFITGALQINEFYFKPRRLNK